MVFTVVVFGNNINKFQKTKNKSQIILNIQIKIGVQFKFLI